MREEGKGRKREKRNEKWGGAYGGIEENFDIDRNQQREDNFFIHKTTNKRDHKGNNIDVQTISFFFLIY